MIQIVLYPNTNQRIAEAYGKWFPRVANTETVALDIPVCHHSDTRRGTRSRSIKGRSFLGSTPRVSFLYA